jgi:hypothetical protein
MGSRDETKFHQAAGIVGRQIDTVKYGSIALPQINQTRGRRFQLVVATQLQHGFSMLESEILVKRLDALTVFFSCHGVPELTK